MIQINEEVRISRLDKYCLQVEVLCNVRDKNTKEIKKEWKGCGYYGNLETAICGVLKNYLNKLTDEEIADLKVLNERIKQIEVDLKAQIKNITL